MAAGQTRWTDIRFMPTGAQGSGVLRNGRSISLGRLRFHLKHLLQLAKRAAEATSLLLTELRMYPSAEYHRAPPRERGRIKYPPRQDVYARCGIGNCLAEK